MATKSIVKHANDNYNNTSSFKACSAHQCPSSLQRSSMSIQTTIKICCLLLSREALQQGVRLS